MHLNPSYWSFRDFARVHGNRIKNDLEMQIRNKDF